MTSMPKPARVCLLAPALQTGDAVGNDVAGMFASLRRRGIEVRVLAQTWTSDVALPVESIADYGRYACDADTLSIYHHATAWADGFGPFLHAAGPKVVRYHGVTPPSFFAPYSAELTHTTSGGRRNTEALARSSAVDLFLADSEHNAYELQQLGAPAERCAVVPPFHTLAALASVPTDVTVLERYLDDTCNVLFVGRVAPNKGHRHLLGVLAACRRLFGRPLRLLLVGNRDRRLSSYHEELALLARGLRVADAVVWTDHVTAAQLKAYYLLAHAFLVMSEHEGFCVPLVEAMSHRIPVVAYGSSAVAETVGDAGLVLRGLDYDHYAAALEIVLTRDEVRRELRARQVARVNKYFRPAVIEGRFTDALRTWLGTD